KARRFAVTKRNDQRPGARLRIVSRLRHAPQNKDLGLGCGGIEVIALGLDWMQLDEVSRASPARSRRRIFDALGALRGLFGDLDRNRLPALVAPAIGERHALHDHGDRKPHQRHGILYEETRTLTSRSYSS